MRVMRLLLLLVLVVGSRAHAQTESVIAQDTSLAHRTSLAKQWLTKMGLDDQLKLLFAQGIEAELAAVHVITEEAEHAKQKIEPLLREEADRYHPIVAETLAAIVAQPFTADELQQCANSDDPRALPAPLREKFDANSGALRAAFVEAGSKVGQEIWANALLRLEPSEIKALERGAVK